MKPDLDALAEEAARACFPDFSDYSFAKSVIRRALQKLQSHHEAERDAAVREAVENVKCGPLGRLLLIADDYRKLWLICHEHNPREPRSGENLELGLLRGRLFAMIDKAIAAAGETKPRSDMVCLPREPSQAMRDAFLKAWNEYPGARNPTQWECFYSAWKAALSAADEQKG